MLLRSTGGFGCPVAWLLGADNRKASRHLLQRTFYSFSAPGPAMPLSLVPSFYSQQVGCLGKWRPEGGQVIIHDFVNRFLTNSFLTSA